MTGEIDRDFFCANAEDFIRSDDRSTECRTGHYCLTCKNMRRKHPTPEQYGEEYGSEVPDNMPVWIFHDDAWDLSEYWRYKQIVDDLGQIDKDSGVETDNAVPVVVACTPWPKPDNNWRPS